MIWALIGFLAVIAISMAGMFTIMGEWYCLIKVWFALLVHMVARL